MSEYQDLSKVKAETVVPMQAQFVSRKTGLASGPRQEKPDAPMDESKQVNS